MLLGLLFTGLSLMLPATAAVQTIAQANVTVTRNGLVGISELCSLPYHWDKVQGVVDGSGRFVVTFPPVVTNKPLALYLKRIGNTFEVRVNGQVVTRWGTFPPRPHDDSVNAPQYVLLPSLSQQITNTLEITIGVVGGRYGGLSALTVGDADEVQRLYASDHFWQITVRQGLVIVTVVLGLLGVLLWVRLRDSAYLYYGLAELMWTALTLRPLLSEPLLPAFWSGLFVHIPLNTAPPLLYKFALIVMEKNHGYAAKFIHALVLFAVPVSLLTVAVNAQWLVPVWQGLMLLGLFVLVVKTLGKSFIAPRSLALEQKILGVALLLLVLCAVRDFWMMRFSPDAYTAVYGLRFAWIGLGISFAWIIAERLRKASVEMAVMNTTLSTQLATRNAELTAAFERERSTEKERGAMEERQRLMRDLHDGLGGQLVGALRVAQQPSASRDDITGQLRDAIDQLKISVDAMQETDGDIPSLLGSVRYRLGPRLNAAGIALHWDVARLPVMPDWGVREAYQLQMLLLEVFTNMVVHSGASTASLCARHIEDLGVVEVEITDNGTGFDVAQAKQSCGKGLASIRMRTASLGAALQMLSKPGETRIVLVFNLSVAVEI